MCLTLWSVFHSFHNTNYSPMHIWIILFQLLWVKVADPVTQLFSQYMKWLLWKRCIKNWIKHLHVYYSILDVCSAFYWSSTNKIQLLNCDLRSEPHPCWLLRTLFVLKYWIVIGSFCVSERDNILSKLFLSKRLNSFVPLIFRVVLQLQAQSQVYCCHYLSRCFLSLF